MTGLSMRTLLRAYRKADWYRRYGTLLSWRDKGERQSHKFYAALLAKIDAVEAQAVADAERIAEMEADRAAALPALKDAYEYWLADATDDEEAAEIAEEQLREHIQDYMAAGLHRDLESGKDWREVERW